MSQEVKVLKAELALLKLQFDERITDVETRLNDILKAEEKPQIEQPQIIANKSETTHKSDQASFNAWEQSDKVTSSQSRSTLVRPVLEESEELVPSFVAAFFRAILTMLIEWLSPVIKIYNTYKERGVLGTFLLTLVGIGLTLSGFGYLMQLLIEQMGAGAKSLLMGGFTLVVSGVGIGLKVKTRYGEFATAIVALGVLLSYSTIYFSGSVYGILPDSALLFLYLLIALVCHALAHWLDTKIIAGLGIIGIATMPILSDSLLIEPIYYLLSLVFVSTSSLLLAYKQKQPWLASLTLVFCVAALEWTVAVENVTVSGWIVNLFYLQFFVYVAYSLAYKGDSEKQTLVLLAATVGATIMLFVQGSDISPSSATFSFLINSSLAAFVATVFYKLRHKLTHFIVMVSMIWGILAIVSAISNAYWGIAWAIEGLLLIFIGRKYLMRSVVNQGQALTAVALIYSWSGLGIYFPLPALMSVDGWILAVVIISVIAIWQRLIDSSEGFDAFTADKVKPALQLLEVVWITVLLVASSNIWVGNMTGALVILVQLALLFRAKQCKQKSIEIFAAALILVPFYYVMQGALLVGSLKFTMLPLFAKLALTSAFVQLWLWSEFYNRVYPGSAMKVIAERARLSFYLLLPVVWLGSALNRLNEDILVILWASPLIALLLATKIKHELLIKETKLLTVVAFLSLIGVVGFLEMTLGLISLTGFFLFLGTAFILAKKRPVSNLNRFIIDWSVLSLALALPIFLGMQVSSWVIGFIAASLLWVGYITHLDRFDVLKRNQLVITIVNGSLLGVSWALMSWSAWFVALPAIFLVGAMSKAESVFKHTKGGTLLGQNYDVFLHTLFAVSYVVFVSSLNDGRFELLIAPFLAIHGALILFLKSRRLLTVRYSFGLISLGIIKLALVDAANSLLWQKVILFMGIGVFILVASFWYQKLVQEPDSELAKD